MSSKKIFSLLFSLALSLGNSHADTIKLKADRWYPFNGDPNTRKPGYIVEMVTKIFEESGHAVEYSLVPWARAIKEAEAGVIDGIIGAAKGDAPQFIFPRESAGVASEHFYTRSDVSWTYSGVGSLAGKKLGYIFDYSYGDTIDSYIKNNQEKKDLLEGVGGDDPLILNIRKLLLGRIDVFVSEPQVVSALLKDQGIDHAKIRYAGEAPEKDEIFVAFSPKGERSQVYADIITKGISELRKNGELSKILNKYGISDWK